ncbi:MAG: hypothetical protein WD557_01405 [Dehalococcoidia bacterium]
MFGLLAALLALLSLIPHLLPFRGWITTPDTTPRDACADMMTRLGAHAENPPDDWTYFVPKVPLTHIGALGTGDGVYWLDCSK